MKLLKFEELPLSAGETQRDGARPVRALYQVTKGGQKTRSGDIYSFDSLKEAAKDSQLQEEIECRTLVGYLGHPKDLIDKDGKNWGSNPFSNKKIFLIESLWADEADQDIKSWVQYLPNKAGLDASDKIRNNEILAVSMVSYKSCDDEHYCNILKICNFDQVGSPNMPTALLLAHKDSAPCVACESIPDPNHHCNKCIKISADGFRSAQKPNGDNNIMKLAYKDKNALLNKDQAAIVLNKDMMNLDQILGMAKGGWLSQEGLVWLEYWCAAVKDMTDQTAAAETSTDSAVEVGEFTADVQKKLQVIGQISDTMRAQAVTKDSKAASILNGMAGQISAFKNAATAAGNPPVESRDSASPQNIHDAAIKNLTDQVASIATTLTAITKDQDTVKAQKDAQAQRQLIKDGLDKLFTGETITFHGDTKEPIIYQRKNFNPDSLQAVKDGAMTANDLSTALFVAQTAMEGLSRDNAANYLKGRGYAGGLNADIDAKGTTKPRVASGKDTTIADHPVLQKMKDAKMAYMRQNDSAAYTKALGRDSKIVAEKKNDLLSRNMPRIEAMVTKADQSAEEIRGRGKDSSSELSVDDFLKQYPVESQKDSADQVLVNATNAIILPFFSAFMMLQEFEPCDAMNLFRGITRSALVDGLPTSSEGWGRVFSFGQEFGEAPTGDDPYLELATAGDAVFEEIGLETTRQEFVARDYGVAVRIGRGDAAALRSDVPAYDVLARLQFRAEEYLNRMRNARMYRALFDAADQVGAISRSESVQAVAPSGTGPKLYIGEYKVKASDVAIEIGGKSFGGVGSNIDAVIRVLGSTLTNGVRAVNTTGSSHANVPICRNYTQPTHSQAGVISLTNVCPASLTIGGTAKTQGSLAVVSGVQMIVPSTAHYAIDQDGFYCLAEGAGHGATPTSPALVTAYYENINFIHMNVAPDLDDEAKFYNKKLYQVADAVSIIRSAPNYGKADTFLMQDRIATNFAKASKFDKQESPNGTNVSMFDGQWNCLTYRGINFVGTVDPLPHGTRRSLIMQAGYAGIAAWLDMFSQPYRAQKADPLTGKIKTLPQLVMDLLTQDCIGVPRMLYPSTHALAGQTVMFPFQSCLHYGSLPSETD